MTQALICERIAHTLATAPIHDHHGYDALAHLKLPGPDYKSVLRALHQSLKPKLYVEIGVRSGASLELAEPGTHCIGIDPAGHGLLSNEQRELFSVASDEFFRLAINREKARGFDLAFIDGDHNFEQALKDFTNLHWLVKKSSLIAIHDVIPMDERTTKPNCESAFWTGDVWRLMAALVRVPGMIAFTVASPPTGLGLIGRLQGPPFGLTPEQQDQAREEPFPATWDEQVKRLNIVPNDADAIMIAFQGKAAA